MRSSVLVGLVFLLALPAVGGAALMRRAGDGTLSVDSGVGKVTIDARGGVIGRFDRGLVTITDLTPNDVFDPVVFGATTTRELPSGGQVHMGTNVRFRLTGGSFRIHVNGSGIDLSAVGNGTVTLEASSTAKSPGTYSFDGDDCRLPRVKCSPLPDQLKRFRLGEEKGSQRSP